MKILLAIFLLSLSVFASAEEKKEPLKLQEGYGLVRILISPENDYAFTPKFSVMATSTEETRKMPNCRRGVTFCTLMIKEDETILIHIDDDRFIGPVRVTPTPVYNEDGEFQQIFEDLVIIPRKAYKV